MKAKVFLSCGQYKGSEEPGIAEAVKRRIEELGFECYVAVTEQSLIGLRENIFSQIETSEYFVFIDFKREKLETSDGWHRGSLFSHQELGIASFLHLPCMVFQERGVHPRDGMLSCFQANAQAFTDRELLASAIADQISRKLEIGEWSIKWKNALSQQVPKTTYVDAWNMDGRAYRHFHVEVSNHHRRDAAQHCYVVLEEFKNLDTGDSLLPQPGELKWAGTILPSIFIAPERLRSFDAFKISIEEPSQIRFNTFCDSTAFEPSTDSGVGEFQLRFGVYSSNFPVAHSCFKLTNPGTIGEINFEQIE